MPSNVIKANHPYVTCDNDPTLYVSVLTEEAVNLKKQSQINHLLARFLAQDEQQTDDDYDDNEPDARDWYNAELEERKRSVFRERSNNDGKP